VAFDQDHATTDEGLSLKRLGQSAKKKTEEAKRSKKPHGRDEVLKHAGEDVRNSQDVLQDDQLKEVQVEDEPWPDVSQLPTIAGTAFIDPLPTTLDSPLDPAKSMVLSRLTGRTPTPPTKLELEYSKLHSLPLATIKAGGGNSILLLGSRGVGKTCLIETALADLALENAEDFHVVRLNGFIQTDDNFALREI
jgi:origin recognition complex subunit 4